MLYAQRFTEQELKDVIVFFKTPTGKKFLAEEPAVIDQGMRSAQTWSQKVAEEVFARFRAEMKKRATICDSPAPLSGRGRRSRTRGEWLNMTSTCS